MIDPEIYHVLPCNDLREHIQQCYPLPFGMGCDCPCKPEVREQENGNILVIHNSFDGREGVEWARELLDGQ